MSASFFSGAHNFSVGEMNVKNVSGDYIDHSTKNVRNTFRGDNTYNTRYDQSSHDSSNHHYGHNYTTTNHNHGPVNNIERVDNANFGTNYGYMNQNTFDGPQQNRRTDHHYNAPTYNYDTHAPGGSVVNGDFHGTQYNGQGFPPPGPQADQYRPPPRQGPPPQSGGQRAGQSARSPPQDDRQHGHGPIDSRQRPAPAPVPGDFTASDPAVPQEQYRQQREQQPANGPPSPGFNPWQNQNQHQPPPNAPYPTERTVTAPGRPQPDAERREYQSHPGPAPPPAFPPAGTQQRAPSPPQQPSASSDDAKVKARSSAQRPKKKDSWEGESELRDTLGKHGIRYSSSESASSIRRRSRDSDDAASHDDGYGVGSGRQNKEKEETKGKEARKDKEPEGGWKENPLLQPENVTFLSAPPRESLPPSINHMPATPTPVHDSLRKSAGSPAPSYKGPLYGQPQPASSARPVSASKGLTVGSSPLPNPPTESSPDTTVRKYSASLGRASLNTPANAPQNFESRPSGDGGSGHEEIDLHDLGLGDGLAKKKKSRNPVRKLVKVFSPSRKKAND